MTADAAVAAIGRVGATVGYLRVSTGEDAPGEWIPCHELLAAPDGLLDLVRTTKAGLGTDRDDVAMSLFVQGYAFRVASLAVGAWLLDDVVLDVAPTNTAIAIGRNRPNAVLVRVPAATAVAGPTAPEVLNVQLVDSHLAPVVDAAHRACPVGERLLWANVGASCAASFGAFVDPLADRRTEIRDRAAAFFAAARPELSRSGRLVRVGSRWAWERNACCLWYRTASGTKCEDCSLWTPEERQERYARLRAEPG